MNNLLPQSIHMHEKFDLKGVYYGKISAALYGIPGSTYKRHASKQEKAKANPTLKDLDFNEEFKSGIILDSNTYDTLMDIIKRDCLVGHPASRPILIFICRCWRASKSWIIPY